MLKCAGRFIFIPMANRVPFHKTYTCQPRFRVIIQYNLYIPLYVTYDQMAPLGEGLLLLTAMGGLYLMGKRRKDGGLPPRCFYALPKKHVIPTHIMHFSVFQ